VKRGEVKVDVLEEVVLSTVSADLEIVSHAGESNIEYEIYGEEEDYEPEIVVAGSRVTINFEKTRLGKKMIFGLISIPEISSVDRVVVRIPKFLDNLRLRTVSGGIKASSIESSVLKLNSVSGTLTLRNIASDEFSSNSVSGDLMMDDTIIRRDLHVSSVSGDCRIFLKGRPPKRAQVATTSGDIRVEIEEVPALEVRVSCVSGDFVHNLNLKKVGKNVYRNSEMPICEFKFTSVSGDVRLRGRSMDVEAEEIYEEVTGDEQVMDDEAQRIKRMFEEGKLNREQSIEILEALGYSEREIEDLLEE